jgi:hypothetical protein
MQALSVLIGRWDMALQFPTNPPGELSGCALFEWMDGGAFLIMRSEIQDNAAPTSMSIIGCDDASGAYSMLYSDDRGVSRIYAMTYKDRAWSLNGKPNQSFQRFRAKVDEDGRCIRGSWEKSQDGQSWEHDFSLTYRKSG